MLGSMLAGTEEAPTKAVFGGGRKYKTHRGMASAAARRVRFAIDRYSVPAKGLDEGVEAYVPYVGEAGSVVAIWRTGSGQHLATRERGHQRDVVEGSFRVDELRRRRGARFAFLKVKR